MLVKRSRSIFVSHSLNLFSMYLIHVSYVGAQCILDAETKWPLYALKYIFWIVKWNFTDIRRIPIRNILRTQNDIIYIKNRSLFWSPVDLIHMIQNFTNKNQNINSIRKRASSFVTMIRRKINRRSNIFSILLTLIAGDSKRRWFECVNQNFRGRLIGVHFLNRIIQICLT